MSKLSPIDHLTAHAVLGEQVVELIKESGLLRRPHRRVPKAAQARSSERRAKKGVGRGRWARPYKSVLEDPGLAPGKE